jgi:hypothetical protein
MYGLLYYSYLSLSITVSRVLQNRWTNVQLIIIHVVANLVHPDRIEKSGEMSINSVLKKRKTVVSYRKNIYLR